MLKPLLFSLFRHGSYTVSLPGFCHSQLALSLKK